MVLGQPLSDHAEAKKIEERGLSGKKNRSYEIEYLSQTAGGSGLADHSGEGVSSPV